jgi:Zn-finger nucleic acid-binding protein
MNKTEGKVNLGNVKTMSELSFELKYCERCGGLWLRPSGGEQTYCVACGRAMAELPAPSIKPGTARRSRGSRWGTKGAAESWEVNADVDEAGGLA